MNRYGWIIICLAYLIGLLATGLFYFSTTNFSGLVFIKIFLFLITIGVIAKFSSQSIFKFGFNLDNKVWITAIVIAILAVIYFNLRIPSPQTNDISNLLTAEKSSTVIVTGKVLTEPRLNSSDKIKFWLRVREAKEENNINSTSNTNSRSVSGKLYVTLPLLLGNSIEPQTQITIQGNLYQPKPPTNPQQFNFKQYLKERGAFAGLTGFNILEQSSKSKWGWYRLRQRIIRAQVKGLGSPWGQLVSSIVLGKKAVDLPENIRDLFIQSGLAHVLAASGFHVSLLLGIVLQLSKHLESKKQLIIGTIALTIYIFLTGFYPSIIRASLMGIAVLIAMSNRAKVRPLGSLLLVAIIILIINPLWIWNLSFQLSFLATLGIIITLPLLESSLDWLPSKIATAIAVPLAASIWVLPLISYVFKTIATYSILINFITIPLVTIISLGGMITSGIALVFPLIGSYCTWLLKYPVLCLIAILNFFNKLPGSKFAVGEISLWLLLAIYSVIILLHLKQKWRKYWWLATLLILSLIILPLRYRQANLLQITILPTNNIPSLIVQDRGQVLLINNANAKNFKYSVMPLLANRGINQIDYLIIRERSPNKYSIIETISSQIPIKKIAIYDDKKQINLINKDRETNPTIKTKSLTIKKLDNSPTLQLTTNNTQWILTDKISSLETVKSARSDRQTILVWLGKNLNRATLDRSNIQTAIASTIDTETVKISSSNTQKSRQIYSTKNRGTITWIPQTGFTTARETAKRNNNL